MKSEKYDYLAELIGKDEANALIEEAESMKEALNQAGVESKETEPKPDDEKPAEDKKETKVEFDSATLVAQIAEKVTEQVTKSVAESLGLDALSQWVEETQKSLAALPVLTEKFNEIMKDDEERLANLLESPASQALYAWQKRQSESNENALDEDDSELKDVKVMSNENWLSNLAGAVPLPKEVTNAS